MVQSATLSMARTGSAHLNKPNPQIPDPRINSVLFPNTPIEVEEENGEWHIYVEGQWHARIVERYPDKPVPEDMPEELSFDDFAPKRAGRLLKHADVLFLEVRRLVAHHGDDWQYVSTRINPEWAKWPDVQLNTVAEIYNGEVTRLSNATKSRKAK